MLVCPDCQTDNLDSSIYCGKCGLFLPDVGQYQILQEHASGGFGTVFRGRSRQTNEPVAIKAIHRSLTADKGIGLRFQREMEIAKRFDHPHIVKVLAQGLHEELGHYFVMEWLEGLPLSAWPTWRHSDQLLAIGFLCQLLDGLQVIHERGTIHRDLKPENLLLSTQGLPSIKILDFGIALSDMFSRQTKTGTKVGTPHFMSPEQLMLAPLDHRSDLYSVGCLMAWMLTGRTLFEGPESEIQYHHRQKLRPTLHQLSQQGEPFAQPLEQAFQKALALDPRDRFQSCHAFSFALQEAPSFSMEAFEAKRSQLEKELTSGASTHPIQFALIHQQSVAQVAEEYQHQLPKHTEVQLVSDTTPGPVYRAKHIVSQRRERIRATPVAYFKERGIEKTTQLPLFLQTLKETQHIHLHPQHTHWQQDNYVFVSASLPSGVPFLSWLEECLLWEEEPSSRLASQMTKELLHLFGQLQQASFAFAGFTLENIYVHRNSFLLIDAELLCLPGFLQQHTLPPPSWLLLSPRLQKARVSSPIPILFDLGCLMCLMKMSQAQFSMYKKQRKATLPFDWPSFLRELTNTSKEQRALIHRLLGSKEERFQTLEEAHEALIGLAV